MTSHITIAGIAMLLFAAGCSANHNTAFRDFDINNGSGAMIDIKQRAIVVSQQTFPDAAGNPYTQTYVCAEPSPDALSAYAAELAAEGGNGQVSASLAAATQETAAFVGLRTQSIQLLRDAFYRACEGYMSGALSPVQFDILTRRYQRYMVALLGIEQLTGAVKAPAITLTTEGQASAAQSLSSLRAQKDAIDADISKLNNEKNTQQAIVAGDADQPKKDAATARIAEIDSEIAELEEDKASIQTGIQNARGLAAGGSTAASVSAVGMPSGRSEAALENLSTTVGEIVKEVLQTDDLNALCVAKLSSKNGLEGNTVFDQICADNLHAIIASRSIEAQANARLIDSVINYIANKNPSASEVAQILTNLDEFRSDNSVTSVGVAPQ